MSFIEAIKQGIANAENFNLNKQEAIEIIEEANKAIKDKTKGSNLCFAEIKENSVFFPNGIVKGISHNSNNYYPLTIRTNDSEYECHNKQDLIESISKILSSSSFGFYIKRFVSRDDSSDK